MKLLSKFWFVFLLIGLLFLAACASPAPEPVSTSDVEDDVLTPAYPPPVGNSPGTVSYPPPDAPTESVSATELPQSYPAPNNSSPLEPSSPQNSPSEARPFQIDKPVYAGTTLVTGRGPAGVPIGLLNITFMGTMLGQTTIGEDGTFAFTVEPLEAGHRIGIVLGILDGTQWTPEYFQNSAFYGDEARSVPLVGFFYDTALVIEKE